MSSASLLLMDDVVRRYAQGGKTLNVLNHLHLNVRKGEMVALVGPSGSGKTTLLSLAGLLDTPNSGSVSIAGEEMSAASDAVRTHARKKYIGFVYQFHHLLPEFSALENVMMPQWIANVPEAESKQKALSLLRTLGLSERVHHRPAKLSGGEQQRVAIARALANDPMLLLADEPTGNLDPETAAQVFSVFMSVVRERGVAALVATHNMDMAKQMDRMVRLDSGVLK